jgi:hypothetical protein
LQGREGDVVGTADAGLEHAAAPDGDPTLGRRVMDGDGLGEASYATDFDVDDAAGVHVDGGEGVAAVAYGFVEADRGVEALLQHGVEVEVVVPEGLLDHEQFELVPLGDVVEVDDAVCGVGVTTELDIGPAAAHLFEDFGVPAGLALELDALVAGGKRLFNLIQQRGLRGLDTDGDAAGDASSAGLRGPRRRSRARPWPCGAHGPG